jgi:hypothetical protein
MDLSNYEKMDPHMLLGVVNTLLRNHCESLEELCFAYDLEEEILSKKLKDAGYEYQAEFNQFR